MRATWIPHGILECKKKEETGGKMGEIYCLATNVPMSVS